MANEAFMRDLTHERRPCSLCAGSGRTKDGARCPQCGGRGEIPPERAVPLRRMIIAGIFLFAAGTALVMLLMFALSHG